MENWCQVVQLETTATTKKAQVFRCLYVVFGSDLVEILKEGAKTVNLVHLRRDVGIH